MDRFSASAIIFCYVTLDPSEPYVLLCQRAYWDHSLGKPNSWGGSWETTGGGHDHGETILDTAIRETTEETGLHISHVSRDVYFDSWVHKGMNMARYTFHAEIREKLQPQRIWCDQQCPVGTKEGGIKLMPDEHMNFCWATEAQVRNSLLYDEGNPLQSGLVILESKRDTILDVFSRLNNSSPGMVVVKESS